MKTVLVLSRSQSGFTPIQDVANIDVPAIALGVSTSPNHFDGIINNFALYAVIGNVTDAGGQAIYLTPQTCADNVEPGDTLEITGSIFGAV